MSEPIRRSLSDSDDFWDGVSTDLGEFGPIIQFIPPAPQEAEFASEDFHPEPLTGFSFGPFSPSGVNEWSDLDTPQRKTPRTSISSPGSSASSTSPLPFLPSPPRKYRKLQSSEKSESSSGPSFIVTGPFVRTKPIKGEDKSNFLLTNPSISPAPASASNSTPSVLFSPSFVDNTDQQMEAIEKVIKKVESLENQMDNFLSTSRALLHQSSESGGIDSQENEKVKEIQHLYHQLGLQIDEARELIKSTLKASILSPSVLNLTRILSSRLDALTANYYVSDPDILFHRPSEPPRAKSVTLLLKDPPVSQVLFKGKGMEDVFHLSLLCNGDVIVEEVSSLDISFTQATSSTPSSKKAKAAKSLVTSEIDEVGVEGDRVERGGERGGVRTVKDFIVRNVHVNTSTRMSVVPLSFSISLLVRSVVGGKKSRFSLSSSSTHPIIAITNESQWMDAEYKLLVKDLFGGDDVLSTIEWCYFANILHRRFLKATKQTAADPSRPFSLGDWRFFHEKFFQNCDVISSDQIVSFWKWFGPIMQTLRFKKHINSLWFSGILFGIVSKEFCTKHLENQRNGTFIVRFSEKFPGLFAVAYVCDDGEVGEGGTYERVKHYLVKPEDTGSQKSLPDFLHEKEQFKYLLRFDFRERQLECVEKDIALKGFYSKSRITPSARPGDIGYQTQVY